jgi:hypothetical protein
MGAIVAYQKREGWCGPAALQEALRVLGVRVGQAKLAKVIGACPEEGSDEHDILQALTKLGCQFSEFSTNRRNDARDWLTNWAYTTPLLLCVDDWDHWVLVAGGCGPRLFLFDSADSPWNKAQNGPWPLLPTTILKRWRAARRNRRAGDLFYGISLFSCDPEQAKYCARSATKD